MNWQHTFVYDIWHQIMISGKIGNRRDKWLCWNSNESRCLCWIDILLTDSNIVPLLTPDCSRSGETLLSLTACVWGIFPGQVPRPNWDLSENLTRSSLTIKKVAQFCYSKLTFTSFEDFKACSSIFIAGNLCLIFLFICIMLPSRAIVMMTVFLVERSTVLLLLLSCSPLTLLLKLTTYLPSLSIQCK